MILLQFYQLRFDNPVRHDSQRFANGAHQFGWCHSEHHLPNLVLCIYENCSWQNICLGAIRFWRCIFGSHIRLCRNGREGCAYTTIRLDSYCHPILIGWLTIFRIGKRTHWIYLYLYKHHYHGNILFKLFSLFFQGEIIRTKSTASLPFPLILCGTLVSFAWLVYGIAVRQDIVIFQNAVTTLMSAIQLSLFAIYPNKPVSKKGKSPKKTNNNNNNNNSKKNK